MADVFDIVREHYALSDQTNTACYWILAVALLALIACLVWCLIAKRRRSDRSTAKQD